MDCGSYVFNVAIQLPVFINLVFEAVEGCCINNMGWKGIPNVSYPITKEPRSYSRVVLLLFHLKTMVSGYALTLDFTVEVEGFLVYIISTIYVYYSRSR